MALRNTSADAGRKGAPSQGKAQKGYQAPMSSPKGRWLPAYSGGMGSRAEADPDFAPPGEEVGVDFDRT